ncbi:MAG: oxygen-dependent coproporphyrinogen oxidase [Candidatus Eisenbacteria bacterium]|uniref:coproporphyrinogen oxidase n=1 Tax=Eiseniibacteriota bacterium TaxID=2212470 RepID=A0A7Y2EA13_UNCEI|nr:oxygen-dependent coproporphyrinogen oxidase [Candidatus Eisenbacteria bacterium]
MSALSESPRISQTKAFLMSLQDTICEAIETRDPGHHFDRRELSGERGGLARPRVFRGHHIEGGAVNFSHSTGASLPPAATVRRPELVGKGFAATSLSLIFHPRNPYAPTTHMNYRFFEAGEGDDAVWWFGGGFELTPYYGFEEDARHWHQAAKKACDPFDPNRYATFKKNCDEYFFLPHRKEARGIGGIFFDDFHDQTFDRSFAFWSGAAEQFLPAYLPILDRRMNTAFTDRERDFQLYRRGRYVEFNLVYDRGTRYGLQAGGRTESILASLPPKVHWHYDWHPELGSPEETLYRDFLPPRDWCEV